MYSIKVRGDCQAVGGVGLGCAIYWACWHECAAARIAGVPLKRAEQQRFE